MNVLRHCEPIVCTDCGGNGLKSGGPATDNPCPRCLGTGDLDALRDLHRGAVDLLAEVVKDENVLRAEDPERPLTDWGERARTFIEQAGQ
jgi:hypothetical protein